MALSNPLAFLLVVLAATAMSAAGQDCSRKITVQNLCGHDLVLGLTPLANSAELFCSNCDLQHGAQLEFPVCSWTGRLSAPESRAPVAQFHVATDGRAWYEVSNVQSDSLVRVSIVPHGAPLQGHCPAAGCTDGGHCFEHTVPGGNCHGVEELKIVYYSP